MDEDDLPHADCHAAAIGILQCLEMLAEEADNLRMTRTRLALAKAIRACQTEQARRPTGLRPRLRRHLVLH